MSGIKSLALLMVLGHTVIATPSDAGCQTVNPYNTATTAMSAIRVIPMGNNFNTTTGAALNTALARWNQVCGSNVPTLSKTAPSEGNTIKIDFREGAYDLDQTHTTRCALTRMLPGGTIPSSDIFIFEKTISGADCTANLRQIIEHELGHALGLAHSNCADNIMKTPLVPGSQASIDDCNAVDRLWLTQDEAQGGGGGGCGVCIPPSYCVLGFCITGCVVKWQCDFPAEDCINGQCQQASPVVARVGAQDYLSVVSVWETAFSDAAGGVCIHWNGKDQKCTMTGWPVDPYVGHLVWLTDEEYALLNLGAELVVDVALNLIGSASPQPSGVSPTHANGFASLERALGSGDRGYTDFSGCPSDFAEGRKLYFWLDHDTVGRRNGLMQASELEPAAYTGLFGFYPETLVESKQVDAHGNWLRFWVEADCADCGRVMVDYFPVLDSGDLLPAGSIPPAGNTCSTVPADLPFGYGPLLTGDR